LANLVRIIYEIVQFGSLGFREGDCMALENLIDEAKIEILEAIGHLEYSLNKVSTLLTDISKLSSEDLETWEGLVARFGRVSDIYLSKYLRSRIQLVEPGFRGSFRDSMDYAEKMRWIDDANLWMEIRQLRNSSVHEYSKAKIPLILERVRELSPHLIALKGKL
jgi:hypothetical protein